MTFTWGKELQELRECSSLADVFRYATRFGDLPLIRNLLLSSELTVWR